MYRSIRLITTVSRAVGCAEERSASIANDAHPLFQVNLRPFDIEITLRQTMQTLQLRLPDFVGIDAQELTLILASRLYEQGKLSIGQAAEMAGMTKRAFMEILDRTNVSAFNYDAEELDQDMHNA